MLHAEGGNAAQATALAIAKAFSQGGSTASAVAQAVAQAIQSQGCGAVQPTLASAAPSISLDTHAMYMPAACTL